tara:strand:+ start:2414 stop:3082 length:669 start_codon:yes stop_codon:yes gene_type:complete
MKGKFELVEEVQNDDGTWSLIFDIDDEFQEWFKERQGLRRWSQKRFQKVLREALVSAVTRDAPALGWKYAQLLVNIDEDGEEQYIIAEIYPLGDNGEYETFCAAHLYEQTDLRLALEDIEKDGINRWFYDNGTFAWTQDKIPQWPWDWKKNEHPNKDRCTVTVQENDDGELYIELPQVLMDQLSWELGDEVEWDEIEIFEDWGEHKGFTLANLTKNPKEGSP